MLRPIYVLGLKPFGASFYLELNLSAFLKRSIPRHLDGREVYEYILAAGPLDESIALGGVKPFHDTLFSHY